MTSARQASSDATLLQLGGWVLRRAARRKLPLGGVMLTLLAKVAFDALKPWPTLILVDYALLKKPMPEALLEWARHLPGAMTSSGLIAWSIASTVLLFLLGWAAGLANAYAGITLGQRMTYDLAGDLFGKLQQLSLHYHRRRSVGDAIRRVTSDSSCVATLFRDVLLPVVSSLITLAVIFVIMRRLSPGLTLLALAVVPAMMVIFRLYAQPMLERSWEQQELEARIYEIIERTFSALPVMQAFGREPFNERRFRQATADDMSATLTLTRVQLQFRLLMGLTTALGTAGLIWLGARQGLAQELSIGSILLFLSYLGSLYAPIEAVMYTSATMQSAAGNARRVWEVLNAERELTDKPGAPALTHARGRVVFENVTFGYEPGRPVLHDLQLDVQPGETIALVGPTGAGKTTLVSLIPRFADPSTGRVLLDGHDLREVQLKSIRNGIGIVLQEPFLFPLTIAENIAYGRPHATLTEIESAARAANAHEFISKLPAGYRTVVGDRGATLSVGERQRLSIARALLKDAPILILDEPTSALDATTEAALVEALERLTRERTTFTIAHRLSTVRRAHRIIVLEQGRIIETGTHAQLLAARGHYARIHSLQFEPRTA
jgi:ATP-binding cassette subfamily B protein/subfamily B ATP-binding cassette protein MsbA